MVFPPSPPLPTPMPMTTQGAKNRKYFTVDLKMLDIFNNKKMYVTVSTVKENASEDWNCITTMFLTSFNNYFVFGYACCICACFMTAVWLFLFFGGLGPDFFSEGRLATLRVISIVACYHSVKLCALATPSFRSQRNGAETATFTKRTCHRCGSL